MTFSPAAVQSKESFVYRAHCLKQILSCVKAKFLGTVQTGHLERKKSHNLKGRASEGLTHQPSFICYEIKADSSLRGRERRGADSWGDWKMRFQVRMRRQKSGQVSTHQDRDREGGG